MQKDIEDNKQQKTIQTYDSYNDLNQNQNQNLINNQSKEETNLDILKQVLKTVFISIPNVLSFASLWFLNFSNLTVTEMFKDEDFVSAYAISFTWTNLFGFALILCLNNGLCTMCSQAIGFNKLNLVSMYYQRSQMINLTLVIVMTLILTNTEAIFSMFTTQKIAQLSQEFIFGYLPSLYFYVFFDSTRNVFNALKNFDIPNLVLSITYTFHFCWVYFFMRYLNLQMQGLGIARSITELCNMVIMYGVVILFKNYGPYKNKIPQLQQINFVITKKAFKRWFSYLKFTVPIASILYMEWTASDIQTIFVAANKQQAQFSGHSAYCSIFLLYVVLPLGVSITILTYIGQAIGKGDVYECKKTTKIGFLSGIVISSLVSILSYFLENKSAETFTNTEGENQYFRVCYNIFNYITIHAVTQNMVIGAILRASGQQNVAFIMPLTCFFILGVPLQYFLVFKMELGLLGSWASYTISAYCNCICLLIMMYKTNWNKQIQIVQNSIKKQEQILIQEEIEEQQIQ